MKVIYTGKFSEFFVHQLAFTVLTIITLGLFGIYQQYWTQRYFFEHMKIEKE